MSQDEFYIGYLDRIPARLGRFIRRIVIFLMIGLVGLALGLAWRQERLGDGLFEFGVEREFSGTLVADPYPALRIERPGQGRQGQVKYSRFQLVAPFKFGAEDLVGSLAGQAVDLRGTLVYRDDQTMIEIVPDSVRPASSSASPAGDESDLGRSTFEGEIVDAKCFLGVMNPGDLKPHRVCAANCIRGGIPPVLVVRQEGRPVLYLHLVDEGGHGVNQEVLDWVAEPVRIEGRVYRKDDLLFLSADPSSYRRIE